MGQAALDTHSLGRRLKCCRLGLSSLSIVSMNYYCFIAFFLIKKKKRHLKEAFNLILWDVARSQRLSEAIFGRKCASKVCINEKAFPCGTKGCCLFVFTPPQRQTRGICANVTPRLEEMQSLGMNYRNERQSYGVTEGNRKAFI